MVPAACQGIIGITLRESDSGLRAMLARIDDRDARLAATAERSLQARLDGSCRTPIAAYAHLVDGMLHLTGLVARTDGSFLLKRSLQGAPADADRIGGELGASLRGDSPSDIFD
jgi:hydroxymethylbilane synthase